jgi:hypothetical protein
VEIWDHHTPFLILSFDTSAAVGTARHVRLDAPGTLLDALMVKERNQSSIVPAHETFGAFRPKKPDVYSLFNAS